MTLGGKDKILRRLEARIPRLPGIKEDAERIVASLGETVEEEGNSQERRGIMKDKVTVKEFCKECGEELTSGHKGPCPKCGKVGKHIHAEVKEGIGIIERGYMKSIKEYTKKNFRDILLMKLIVIIGLILGFFISGIIGAIIGIIIAIASDLLVFKPVEKIKEIHHRSF